MRTRIQILASAACFLMLAGCTPSPHDLVASDNTAALATQLAQDPTRANDRDTLEKTALFFAVQYKRPEAMAMLVDAGADLNAQDISGMTPLHAAAMYGRREATEWLLSHGADPKIRDHFGDTPLHTAAVFGQGGVVKALKAAGAPLDSPNNAQKTPVQLAEAQGHERFVAYFRKLD